ncbi:acyl-CoA carboxylase epsilon subunit [Streptomyces sp. NPDC003006]
MRTADIRIEKGEVTAAELAAVTLLLLTRATPPPSPSAHRPKPTTPWRHDNYQAPHSWQG